MSTDRKMGRNKRDDPDRHSAKESPQDQISLDALECYRRWQLRIELVRQSKWYAFAFGAVGVAWALRGQVTIARFAAAFLYDNGVDWMPWVLFGLSAALNVFLIARQGQRIRIFARREKGLELQLDSRRESSGILSTGQTNPEDEL